MLPANRLAVRLVWYALAAIILVELLQAIGAVYALLIINIILFLILCLVEYYHSGIDDT